MSKNKKIITHTPYNYTFNYSDKNPFNQMDKAVKEGPLMLESIDYHLEIQLQGVKADSPDKFRIVGDLKEAVDKVLDKYK